MINSITLDKIIKEHNLEVVYTPDIPENIKIYRSDISRPGLQLAGFFDHFEPQRIQLIGNAEYFYLNSLDEKTRRNAITDFLKYNPTTLIYTSAKRPCEIMRELCEYFEVPLLVSQESSSIFTAALIAFLNLSLAPQITRHGVLVEVYGQGVLILGDSGVGKSETAIELIKRGHRLIADDAVEIKKVSAITLLGKAPEVIRYYIELRGIGIVDVRRIFGMGSVKETEKIDMIIHLEPWVQGKMYDRFGLETEFTEIIGIKVPTITIPVKPGRNLAVIIEIAAMNFRQKLMGYNTAEEFNERLMKKARQEENS